MKLTHNIITKLISLSFLIFLFNTSDAQNKREVGNIIFEDIPEIPQEIKSRIQQYQNTRSASFADWMPNDEGILISTRFGNTSQLHTVASPGASRNQITFFNEPVRSASFCPSPEYNGFFFSKDIGGNEFSQVFWYDLDTRNTEMIRSNEKRRESVMAISFGKKWIYELFSNLKSVYS